jgi:hypothetical protein
MFRSSMRSSSGSSLFISLSTLLILENIKIFKKYYQSIVVMWQYTVPQTDQSDMYTTAVLRRRFTHESVCYVVVQCKGHIQLLELLCELPCDKHKSNEPLCCFLHYANERK